MAGRGDDELDLNLSNIDAGLRLLGYLVGRVERGDEQDIRGGEAFLIESLIRESNLARTEYERLSRLAAAEAGNHHAA